MHDGSRSVALSTCSADHQHDVRPLATVGVIVTAPVPMTARVAAPAVPFLGERAACGLG